MEQLNGRNRQTIQIYKDRTQQLKARKKLKTRQQKERITDMKSINTEYLTCPIRNVIDRFGDKWSLLVLYHIHKNGTLRYGQIYKEMTDVSQKMLSATLKDLERDHLIKRKAYPEVPPRVEYSLTPLGESLMPHIESLIGWAVEHFQDVTGGKVLIR